MTARQTASNVPGLWRISAQTVRNSLRENGLRVRRPYFGAILRRRYRLARVRWCNTVRGWELQNRRRVWFIDESRLMLQKRYGRTRVYRRRNERFARNCALEDDNFGGGSVIMWGAISYTGKTQLVHIPGNRSAARGLFWNSFDSVVYFGTVSTVWFILFFIIFQIYYSVRPFSFVYNNRSWGFRPFLYQMRYLWQQGRSLLVVLVFQYEK